MADSVLAWFDCGHQQMKSIRICSDHLILLSLFKQISSLIRRADKFLKLLLALNTPRPNITLIVAFAQRLTKLKVTQFSILQWLIKYLRLGGNCFPFCNEHRTKTNFWFLLGTRTFSMYDHCNTEKIFSLFLYWAKKYHIPYSL